MNQPQMARPTRHLAASAVLSLAIGLACGLAAAANLENGKRLVELHNCTSCHGAKLDKPISPAYPKLSGQHADYLYWAMRQYQMGITNPLFGRSDAIMQAQTQNLSSRDMKDIAAYIESLTGSLVLKK